MQFLRRSFNRIRRALPDTASRRFHATRPKPQSRKPAWLPFYTGGDSSLRLVLSAFIFRLPCGQQRSITPPCESNRPPPSLRDNGRLDCAEALRGLSHFRTQPRTRLCVTSAGIEPATCGLQNRRSTIELASYETCASGGFVIFWITLCHTPLVLPAPGHTELQDFRRNARPSPSTSA